MEDAEFIKPPGNVFEAKRILSDLGLHPSRVPFSAARRKLRRANFPFDAC